MDDDGQAGWAERVWAELRGGFSAELALEMW
jgi:hypothetical protein